MIILTGNPQVASVPAGNQGCATRWGQHLPATVCEWTADPGWNAVTITLTVIFSVAALVGAVLLWRDPPPGDQTWREWWDSLR